MKLYAGFLKRVFDFVVALVAIIILSPLIIATCIVLFIVNKSEPLFYQDRPGKNESRIRIIKFKSMTDERDANGNLLPDVQRLTKAGNFCRKYSLDELPQLFNVLKGDMSLVGPRPLLFKYLPLYNAEQKRRHEVRPGITGWAQVNGRNSIGWQEKFKYDVYYVDHLSLLLDLKILWLTFIKVFKKEGVNQSAERPMQPFEGN
jgi:undecaprenyl phosphate N,N'-diacetylbacillosamine 1-phosphate transferase